MVIVNAKQPQFGHARAMGQNMIEYLETLAQQGDCLKIPLFLAQGYYLNHPDDIRQVLVAQADSFLPTLLLLIPIALKSKFVAKFPNLLICPLVEDSAFVWDKPLP